MVYTVTLNPALDYIVFVNNFSAGTINKMKREVVEVGGKGINVSIILSELGVKSKALGFVAGFTGDEIERRVSAFGVQPDFVKLQNGLSRINVKLKNCDDNNKISETEINSNGPDISDSDLKHLFEQLDELRDGDVLVLAGSVPKSLPTDIYERIMEYVLSKKVKVAVDATGKLLTNALKYKPFLIKPNVDELGEIFGAKPSSKEEIINDARKLRKMGAQNVLVSMAGDGAFLVAENGNVYFCSACKGNVKNSVGAGDSMLAGFLAAITEKSGDYEYALKLGTAAGGATAFSDGLAKKSDIIELLNTIIKVK